jgi:hypothetical protein
VAGALAAKDAAPVLSATATEAARTPAAAKILFLFMTSSFSWPVPLAARESFVPGLLRSPEALLLAAVEGVQAAADQPLGELHAAGGVVAADRPALAELRVSIRSFRAVFSGPRR